MKSIAIIGAGVAGLTAGYHLSRGGIKITVVEREDRVGGLARSFRCGDFIFDVGPHRFHTDDQKVLRFIKMTLGRDFVVIPRSSGVYFYGKYHDWPLRLKSLFKLPPGLTLRVVKDLLYRRRRTGSNFEDYIINMYGKTLYDTFFKIYTQKFLKHNPTTIHSDWAQAGIDRAVIDKKMQANTLFRLIQKTLLPAPITTEFIYPSTGRDGIQLFSDRLWEEIRKNKGEIKLNTTVQEIKGGKKQIGKIVLSDGSTYSPDLLIWTAPINVLCRLLGLEAPPLRYLSALLYNVEVEGEPSLPYQWCYYGQEDIIFNRISIPKNFYPGTAPPGKTGISLEVTCLEGDGVWKDPEKLFSSLKDDMVKVGLVPSSGDVRVLQVEKVINVYPIYELDYLRHLQKVLNRLSRIPSLLLLGRTGTFWYNNMDHSIAAGMEAAEDIISSQHHGIHPLYHRNDFWSKS